MSATMRNMDYRLIDVLNIDQLEVNDLIRIDEEIVSVVNLSPLKNGYAIEFQNEFGEKDILDFDDYERFELYILE